MKLFLTLFFTVCLFASSAYAATLSLDARPPIAVGGTITVDVLVDTGDESINSADISIRFPPELLTFSGYGDGAMQLWIERPHMEGTGTIRFSGVIPGGLERGYDPAHPADAHSTLVRLFFRVKAAGSGELTIPDSEVLKNDGLGTSVPVTTVPYMLQTSGTVEEHSSDTIPPQPFGISIMGRSVFGKTPRLAIFSATDAQSGIDHYEARIQQGEWFRTTSPYALPFRLFSYTVTVRAFDFAGNYQEQSVSVPGEHPKQAILLALLIGCMIGFLIYKNKNKIPV